MKLIINFPTANGGQFAAEASSIVEFEAIRTYLAEQGLVVAGAAGKGPSTATPPAADAKAEGTVKEGTKPAAGGKGKGAAKETPAEPAAKAADTAKTAAGPTIEEVVAEMTKVADEFGVPEALILNKRFGVKKAGELKEAQYADYIKFAKHCIADKVAPSGAHPAFDGGSTEPEEDVTSLV